MVSLKTRHVAILSAGLMELGKFCGEPTIQAGLSTGQIGAFLFALVDYAIARVKNAKGNKEA